MKDEILKHYLLFSLVILILLSGSGCIKKTDNYEEDILSYLEAKYNEKFEIESMFKEINVGSADVIKAKVHSERFPGIPFTVYYHLSFGDIHNEENIIELLKQADAYNEEYLKEWEEDVEPYFEDDYTNIVNQDKFDKMFGGEMSIDKEYLINSVFTTPNHFPTLFESQLDLNSYMSVDDFDIYAYHFLFIKEDGENNNSKLDLMKLISDQISVSSIRKQYILFYFINDYSSDYLQQKFFENYKDPNAYFENIEGLTANGIITIDRGNVVDSHQDILNMLER